MGGVNICSTNYTVCSKLLCFTLFPIHPFINPYTNKLWKPYWPPTTVSAIINMQTENVNINYLTFRYHEFGIKLQIGCHVTVEREDVNVAKGEYAEYL